MKTSATLLAAATLLTATTAHAQTADKVDAAETTETTATTETVKPRKHKRRHVRMAVELGAIMAIGHRWYCATTARRTSSTGSSASATTR